MKNNLENIAPELKQTPQWILWRYVKSDKPKEKPRKVPINPHNGGPADGYTTDPNVWATFEQAVEALKKYPICRGLGFVFTKDDPFVGLDFDGCRNVETEYIDESVRNRLDEIGSYTEISPSGKGLHTIVNGGGYLPDAITNVQGIEVYSQGRYFTVTGKRCDRWGEHVLECQDKLQALVQGVNKTKIQPQQGAQADVTLITTVPEITEGMRNNTMFKHIAELHDKGYARDKALEIALLMNHALKPPLSEKEVAEIVQSAYSRVSNAEKLADAIYKWVVEGCGDFSSDQMCRDLGIQDIGRRHSARNVLYKLQERGIIEPTGERKGWWRRKENDLVEMDLKSDKEYEFVDILYPGGIHLFVRTQPGNIVIIAGDVNAGKTAWCFNLAYMNIDKHPVHYFSSEMGEAEMRYRLDRLDPQIRTNPNFHSYERDGNFHDVVKPGKGNINIIDYLEVTDEFYKVGHYINQIFRRLDGAVAVIALQKKGLDSPLPLGGFRGLEKARLALSMSAGNIHILKAKMWTDPLKNPNGLNHKFEIKNGCDFIWNAKGWHFVAPKSQPVKKCCSFPHLVKV